MSLAPRENPLFAGHQTAVAALYSAAMSGRLHHGWLIAGPPGIGKATLAYRFARWLLAGGTAADLAVDEKIPSFQRIAAGTHADLFTVERRINVKTEKLQSEIVINTVQEACKFMRLTPAEGGWRVVVIDGAEDMNPNAANALLKLLEEPPAKAILLLVTSAPGRLLPTIRSRCRNLALAPLRDGEMEALLEAYAPELGGAEKRRLVGISEGSIGTALNMAEEGGVAIAALVDEVLAAPVPAGRAQNIAETVTRAVEGADKFVLFMDLLRGGLAAATRRAARAGKTSLAANVAVWQEIGRIEREVVGLNLDKRAAIIVAISALHGS
jgi:DNA polymerase-3 subunit delta'